MEHVKEDIGREDMESKRKTRLNIIVKGKVQGVGYREYVQDVARKLDVVGYVENLEDSSVRVVAECNREIANVFLDKLRAGHERFNVEAVNIEKDNATEDFEFFEIRRVDIIAELSENLDKAVRVLMAIRRDLRDEIVEEIRHQISTLRQERLLLFEKDMLSNMHERFTRYDNDLQKLLEMSPCENSVISL